MAKTGNLQKVSIREVRAQIIKAIQAALPQSQQIPDPFQEIYGKKDIIAPPYDLDILGYKREEASILERCVNAMEVNIHGFGYNLPPRIPEEEAKAQRTEIEKEQAIARNFFENAHPTKTWIRLCRDLRRDYEYGGFGGWEVLRNGEGMIAGLEPIPFASLRLGKQDDAPTDATLQVIDHIKQEITDITYAYRFRKYAQVRGSKIVYFKEYMDPREMDRETSEYYKDDSKPAKPANEVIFFGLPTSVDSPYPLPRWIGNLPDIVGSRAAEEVNLYFFKQKGIPKFLILVSGGKLTQSTIDRIEDFCRESLQKPEDFHSALIMEAMPFDAPNSEMLPEDKIAPVKIEVVPFAPYLKEDALFLNYKKECRSDLLSAYRLPPIIVGLSDDYNRATVEAAKRAADEQVFQPERDEFDAQITLHILVRGLGLKLIKYESRGATLSDIMLEKAEAITLLAAQGAATINDLRDTLGKLIGKDLQPFEQPWANIPISIIPMIAMGMGSPGGNMSPEEIEKARDGMKLIESLREIRRQLIS